MHALTEQQVRRSFLNCSQGEAKGLALPTDFGALDWAELELLGWRDPKAPLRGYLVVESGTGRWASRCVPPTCGCRAAPRRCACSARPRSPGTPSRCSPRSGPARPALAENAAHLTRALKAMPYPGR